MTRERFEQAFLEFLRKRNEAPALSVSAADNLFHLGLLDSFAIPHLITHLECALGTQLDLERGGLETFFSIERAFRAYSSDVHAG